MSEYELGVIGGGNMAQAIVRGVMRSGVPWIAERSGATTLPRIVVSDPSEACRAALAADGVAVTTDNHVPARCMRVLMAVKPQMLAGVLAEIAPTLHADATVISIAAGISAAAIDKCLGGKGRIVRVMPNTPILVGQGMSALAAGPRATADDLDWARKLFGVSGLTCIVDERDIDAVTAVSGSGPAYFFYLVEAMVAAGEAEGLDKDVATQLAVQTCMGAATLLLESKTAPEILRAKVTSPNGTTQRAIETMDAAGVKDNLIKAMRAAAARSRELGK